jgi:hypothetical protein
MENNGIPGPEEYLKALEKLLEQDKTTQQLYQAIVDAPFHDKFQTTVLDLGFLAFLRVNEETKMIDRITISQNEIAQGAIDMTQVEFQDMKVPVSHLTNIVAQAIRTGKYKQTNDWHELTDPALPAEDSRFNQAAAGVASSVVYPLMNIRPKAAIIYQFYINLDQIGSAHHNFMTHYTRVVAAALKKRQEQH